MRVAFAPSYARLGLVLWVSWGLNYLGNVVAMLALLDSWATPLPAFCRLVSSPGIDRMVAWRAEKRS